MSQLRSAIPSNANASESCLGSSGSDSATEHGRKIPKQWLGFEEKKSKERLAGVGAEGGGRQSLIYKSCLPTRNPCANLAIFSTVFCLFSMLGVTLVSRNLRNSAIPAHLKLISATRRNHRRMIPFFIDLSNTVLFERLRPFPAVC